MSAAFDLAANGCAIRLRSETHEGHEHELLELAKVWSHRRMMFHIVDDMSTAGGGRRFAARDLSLDLVERKLNGFAAEVPR